MGRFKLDREREAKKLKRAEEARFGNIDEPIHWKPGVRQSKHNARIINKARDAMKELQVRQKKG